MGIVVWARGWMLRRLARDNIQRAAEEWEGLEKRHLEVERALRPLLGAGRYDRGLSARLEAARAEAVTVCALVSLRRLRFRSSASMSAATARETETIVGDFHG